ncbi:MAG: DNA-formamidopyrimidine glycosylase family protein [Acidimicrobiia bacterium]
MPELPDIVVYLEALERRISGETVRAFRVASPSVLRTYDPPYDSVVGTSVTGLRRIGKRIVWDLDDGKALVIHLMIAGRLKWSDKRGGVIPKKVGLCAWDFDHGMLLLTEQGTKRRAGVWVFADAAAAAAEDRRGAEPLEVSLDEFTAAITRENRTLKRALTDPRILSGIGNAFSDEILWAAGMSPVKRTGQLTLDEIGALYDATRASLTRWTDILREAVGEGWPDKVTAFRPEMAVHGKFGEPCPRCGSKVQRIVYAANETNYCATCQTGGKLLADRSLSRLLKDDWPRTLEDLEERTP